MRLDTRTGRIDLNGAPVKLTAQEQRILAYLLHHQDRTVSRTELTEHVYDQDFDLDSNVIEVLIARLRKKLGVPVIETVRGLGYRVSTTPVKNEIGTTSVKSEMDKPPAPPPPARGGKA